MYLCVDVLIWCGSDGPELTVNSRSTGQRRGREVVLECTVDAFPYDSLRVDWVKNRRRVTQSDSHDIHRLEGPDHTVTLRVVIRDLTGSDFGDYKCVANNTVAWKEVVVTVFGRLQHTK